MCYSIEVDKQNNKNKAMTNANTTAQIATSLKVIKEESVKVLKMQVTLGGDWLCLAEIEGDKKCLILRSNNICSLASEMAVRDITAQVKGKTLEWMCNQHFDTFYDVPCRTVPSAVRKAYYAI